MNAAWRYLNQGRREGLPEDAASERDLCEQRFSLRDLGGRWGHRVGGGGPGQDRRKAQRGQRLGDGKKLGASEEQNEEAASSITICLIMV